MIFVIKQNQEKIREVICLILNPSCNIRIYHDCEGTIEKSVSRITVWHHEAYRVMTNGDHEGPFFLSYHEACRVMTNGDHEERFFSILTSHE